MAGGGQGKIFIFSAASGAGKTTLLNHLRQQVPELVYCVSVTTRPPRAGEEDGVHYHFISADEFQRRAGAGEFAEWQQVHGNSYGTPRRFIDETVASGRHVVKELDVYGKLKFDRAYPEAIGILVVPPSVAVLEQRLRARGTESEEAIRTRLGNAADEMRVARERGKYEHTVVNDDLDRACAEVVRLVRSHIGGG